jgi:hypothetical protein
MLQVLESTSACYRFVCVSPAIEWVLTHLWCDCRLTTTPQLLTHFCVTPVFYTERHGAVDKAAMGIYPSPVIGSSSSHAYRTLI